MRENQSEEAFQDYVCGELRSLSARLGVLEEGLVEKLNHNTQLTSEILSLFATGKSGFRILGWMGKFIVWIGGITGAVTAIIVAWHQLGKGE